MRRFLFPALLAIAATLYFALLFFSSIRESQTFDEAAHLAAGYSYWLKHDYRVNPEHPPLMKLLCSAPLLLIHPSLPSDAQAWRDGDQIKFGYEFLYRSGTDAQRMLMIGRAVTIAFTALFVFAATYWTAQAISRRAALIAFLFFALDPNLAAHGRYITNDIFVAGFCFFAIVFWYQWLTTGRTRFLWAAGAALSLALASKFNAMFLGPVFFLIWLYHRLSGNPPRRKPLLICSALVLLPIAIIVALYGGDTRSVAQDPVVASRLRAQHKTPAAWERIPVPAYYWLRGNQVLFRHQYGGFSVYFMGRVYPAGIRAYFPLVILVKTATGTLLLTAAALLYFALPSHRKRPFQFSLPLVLLIPIFLYLWLAVGSRIDFGVRHILLIYPLLYLLLACCADKHWNRTAVRIAVSAALLINALEFARIYPNQLAFFNTLAGGPTNAPKYVLDSNADWGQGLVALRDFRNQHPRQCLTLTYWGTADVDYYLPGIKGTPTSLAEAKAQPCLIAVSLNSLYADSERRWSYLQNYKPVARPSYSIDVYDPRTF